MKVRKNLSKVNINPRGSIKITPHLPYSKTIFLVFLQDKTKKKRKKTLVLERLQRKNYKKRF